MTIAETAVREAVREYLLAHARSLTVERFETEVETLSTCVLAALEQSVADLLAEPLSRAIEPDYYVTTNLATIPGHYNAVVMKRDGEEYIVYKISRQLSRRDAEALADSWAKAGQWERRK